VRPSEGNVGSVSFGAIRLLPQLSLILLLVVALTGCGQPERVPDISAPSPEKLYQEALYIEAADQGAAVYRIATHDSHLLVHVGRTGRLKNLGHDHAIASEDIDGMVMLSDDPAASRADLVVPLRRLIVDEPGYRARIGLASDVSESAIEGTTGNMQDKVLESAAYPWALVSARFASAQSDPPTLSVSVTLHGTAFDYVVPVALEIEPGQLVIEGDMTMRHEDFGLTPFSAAGGLLRVAEELELEFRIVAARL
jgi:hypothetical protein